MTLKISHLVVDGCSLTYCQGLENPKQQGWPALLAKKLNVPVVNLAIGGSGNDAIHRRTIEYVYKNLKTNSNPFFIIAFSGSYRKELYLKEYNKHKFDTIPLIDFSASGIDYLSSLSDIPKDISLLKDESQIDFITNLSLIACERRKLLLWASVINTFKAHNIPYFTTDYIPTEDKYILKSVENNLKEICHHIYSDENKLINFDSLTKLLPKLPCNHDGLEAQELIADYVYDMLIKKYKNIKTIESDFLSLRAFYGKNSSQIINKLGNTWF